MKSALVLLLAISLVSIGTTNAQDDPVAELNAEGEVFYWEDDFDAALDAFNQVLDIDPDNVFALSYRCATYRVTENLNMAHADCTRALEIDPQSGVAQSMNARLLAEPDYLNFDIEAAVETATLGVQLEPNSWLTYYNRGYIYRLDSLFPLALADFDQAIKLGMEYRHVYLNTGAMLVFTIGDSEGGLEYLEAGLERYPDDPQMLFLRGTAHMNMGELETSLDDLYRAAELDPDYAPPMLNIGYINSVRGYTAAALAGYEGWLERIEQERIELEPLTFGKVAPINMTYGRVVVIPLALDAATSVSVTATAVSDGVDPILYIFDADGLALAVSDDTLSAEDTLDLSSALLDIPLPAGTYTIIVTHAGGGSEGRIDVRLERGF